MNEFGSKMRDEEFLDIWRRLKERSSWWYIDGELVHCNSLELERMQKVIEEKKHKIDGNNQ
ncbi:hypothetical protein [Paenibacillus polymyxa]|uniref:Uncharacterized protein n=1 Tax=Paenibacillus polymyxa TaxID=1406 RepID=A0ABX2ZEY8_PAEPO|nr:hypothetical protein [Paenibacillus polymyxa]ODA09126.1 hypothetical protein A7312_27310 [Paenibacillus polymyxa]